MPPSKGHIKFRLDQKLEKPDYKNIKDALVMYLADKDPKVQTTIFDKFLPDLVLPYLNDNFRDWEGVKPK